jgi:uncharacterized protein (DUF983 family)
MAADPEYARKHQPIPPRKGEGGPQASAEPVSPFRTGLTCRCPRCGKGKLFAGYLTVAPGCTECGLDYAFVDSGDGPAVFIILVVGIIVVGLAAVTEALLHPAPYVHLLLWIPATIILSLALLRPFKATMIALQFHHRAEQGRPQ